MTRYVLVALTSCLLVAANAPDDEVKKEREKLKGTWSVVSAEASGTPVPPELAQKIKVSFDGDKMTLKEGDTSKAATITLDPSKKPKTIDMTADDGPQKGKVLPGIYQLEGDDLKLCLGQPGKEQRPAEFDAKAGSNALLIILERDKP